jgi:spore coat polysaccharide biosynthesis protein SpsF (cytidylyltransferase family)
VLIVRLVTTAEAQPGCDYISYCSSDGQPTILSSLGPFAEWCSAAAIARADAEATRPVDRQGVTHYLHSHAQRFCVRLLRIPRQLERSDVRLRIDGQENWEEIQVIYDALGPEEWDWNHLAGLLDRQPGLRKRKPLQPASETSH